MSSTTTSLPPDPSEVLDKLRELVSPAFLQHDTSVVHIRAMALAGRLKSLYRQANVATRIHKEQTAAARQEMDQSHLQLQNLLYEKRHLEREIEKCRQFAWVPFFVSLGLLVILKHSRSIYQDVPLYTLDEFVQLAPPEARTEGDEHQLMLNRLSFELVERQR